MQIVTMQKALRIFPDVFALGRDPCDTDDNIHAFALGASVFVTPQAVLRVVPVRARRAVHASSSDWLGRV